MDSRHAQTQSYEQWDFMKREIRASRTCSVTQDGAQQAELQSQRLSLERNYAEALTWITHLYPYALIALAASNGEIVWTVVRKIKKKILERKVTESKSETAVANHIFWIARLAPYVDGGISVLPPHHAVESTRVVPDHENPSFASVVDPKYQSRETIRSITRDPAAWTS